MSLNARTVLVTGANRGIGLELVKQILGQKIPPKHLIATCRNPSQATTLQELAVASPALHVLELEVTDSTSIKTLQEEVCKIVGDEGLNILINNAGISSAHKLDSVTEEIMLRCYRVNTIAPLMLTKALLPNLRQASKANSKQAGDNRVAVVTISSILGSIALTKEVLHYSYNASKAAVNMVNRCLAADLRADGILSVALHPGWVATDMGGPNAKISPTTSVEGILKVIGGLTEEDSGKFYGYDGIELPW